MSIADEPDLSDLAAAYALGALTPDEARRFEAFLATSPEAQREVAEFRETAAVLAMEAGAASPAPDLRDRVLAAIAASRVRPFPADRTAVAPPADAPARAASRGLRGFVWGALAASVAAAIGLGLQVQRLARRVGDRDSVVANQRTTLAKQEATLQEQSERLQRLEGTLASIFAPGTELVQLTANGNPDPRIQLFWDRRRNLAVLHAANLRPAPAGRTYQLWFIQDGKPVPSVTFNVEQSGDATVPQVSVPGDGKLSAAAVTEEPAGGSQQPTSAILLVGAIAKS
jgi:anti-sigma-K factor RskA